MVLAEPLTAALLVGETLDALGIPWLVVSSVASSLHGIPRSTQDVDIVADLRAKHVSLFVAALVARYYVDSDAVMDAVNRRTSCNLIHLETMPKVDIFAMKGDAWSRSEMERRQHFEIQPGVRLPVASPEDIVLQRLSWFRKGGGVSERQWRDVVGVRYASRSPVPTHNKAPANHSTGASEDGGPNPNCVEPHPSVAHGGGAAPAAGGDDG